MSKRLRIDDWQPLQNLLTALLLSVAGLLSLSAYAREIPTAELASEAEVEEAFAAFQRWAEYYLDGRYKEQYALIHKRIRKYKTQKSWVSRMRKSVLTNGPLEKIDVIAVGALPPNQIPCTEMQHCYRKDMQTVMIVVNSQYGKIGPMEKEYIIMANSDDGWMYGGGTFLNRPYGETMGILDRKDERAVDYQHSTLN